MWGDLNLDLTRPISEAMKFEWQSFIRSGIGFYGRHKKGYLTDFYANSVCEILDKKISWHQINNELINFLRKMGEEKANLLYPDYMTSPTYSNYSDVVVTSWLSRFQTMLDKSICLAFYSFPQISISKHNGPIQPVPVPSVPPSLPPSFNRQFFFIDPYYRLSVEASSSTGNTLLISYKNNAFPLLYNKPKNIYLFLEANWADIDEILSAKFSENNQFIAILYRIYESCELVIWSSKSGKSLCPPYSEAEIMDDNKWQMGNHNLCKPFNITEEYFRHFKSRPDDRLAIKYVSNDAVYIEGGLGILKFSPITTWPAENILADLPSEGAVANTLRHSRAAPPPQSITGLEGVKEDQRL